MKTHEYRFMVVCAAASVLAGAGCGSTAVIPPGVPSAPPHNGSMVRLPDDQGFVEIVDRDPEGVPADKATVFEVALYFLKPDAKTPFSPAPTDVSLTLELPDGPMSLLVKPLESTAASDPTAAAGFVTLAGPYGHKKELRGEVKFTHDGKSQSLPFAFR